jgi:hypothetical protein
MRDQDEPAAAVEGHGGNDEGREEIMAGMKITKGIRPPEPGPCSPTRYPFADMALGDSFFVKGIMESSIRSACSQWKRRHEGWGYKIAVEKGGLRVWRVK